MNGGLKITSDNIVEMGVNGTFFDKTHLAASGLKPVAFPIRSAAGKPFQGYLTQYTVNTLLASACSTGNTLDVTYLLEKFFNLTVTTDNLAVVIPEVLTQYGSGKAVSMAGKFITDKSAVTMTKTNNEAKANLAITVTIDGAEAIYAEFNGINAIGQVSSKSGKIFGALSTSKIGTIAGFRTGIKGMTKESLTTELSTIVAKEVAVLNGLLKAGIVIPTVFGIDISDIELNCNDGFVEGGISVGPTFWQGVKNFMIWSADELRNIRAMNKIERINEMYKVDKLEAVQMLQA